ARVDVHDRLPERLPDGAAPARVEGAHDLVAAVRRRAGGEPERVRALDAAHLHAQIGHVSPMSKCTHSTPNTPNAPNTPKHCKSFRRIRCFRRVRRSMTAS